MGVLGCVAGVLGRSYEKKGLLSSLPFFERKVFENAYGSESFFF